MLAILKTLILSKRTAGKLVFKQNLDSHRRTEGSLNIFFRQTFSLQPQVFNEIQIETTNDDIHAMVTKCATDGMPHDAPNNPRD